MSVNLSVEYKAQFIGNIKSEEFELTRIEINKVFDDFDAFVKNTLT
jgi:hypothetical protein